MNILAIDPANEVSGYCIVDTDSIRIETFGIETNAELSDIVRKTAADTVVIEMIASYGMPVGKEVFETCVWIGRFAQIAEESGKVVEYVYRKDEKMTICHDSRAKDTNIRQALIDRFASHDYKNGKGTKSNPDFFYGFRRDMWAAFAVAVTWIEMKKEKSK